VPTAAEVMTWAAQQMGSKKLDFDFANKCAGELGLTDMSALIMRPDLIPAFCVKVGYANQSQ
jgi:hypothetical protein